MTHNVWNSPSLASFATKIHKKGRWCLCNPISDFIDLLRFLLDWVLSNSNFSEKDDYFFFNETFFRNLKQSVLLLEEKLERQMSQDSLAKQTWHRSIFCTLRRSSPLKSIFSELFCYNKLLQLEPNRNTHTFLPRQKIQSSIRWDEDFLPLPLAFLIRKQLIMMILLAAGGEWMFP
mgnify:CR=1 FL=1